MITIGLLREGKIPADNRVALTPAQCKWIHKNSEAVKIVVQSSADRCFTDKEYEAAGVEVRQNLEDCEFLFGIKEVPVGELLEDKTYLFFSHTRKMQAYNRDMFRAILDKRITLIDYECLEHEDGQRVLGFGFFAGIVGAHNGIMAHGERTGQYKLERVYKQRDYRDLIHTYFGLKLPTIKVAVTGSGRVAHGVLEVMNLMGLIEVEADEFLARDFSYPVFTQLKGPSLYRTISGAPYDREDFHQHPGLYRSAFAPYARTADILMNGIYWDRLVPRLFEWEELAETSFRIRTIADITDDREGSIPCNLGDSTIPDPVYGVDRISRKRTAPYLPGSVDVMAVGNLPNELPRDASRYFGEQLIKYLFEDLVSGHSPMLERATLVRKGKLTDPYKYLREYAGR